MCIVWSKKSMGNIHLLFSDSKEFMSTEISKIFFLMVFLTLLVIVGLFLLHLEINHVEELLVARSMIL